MIGLTVAVAVLALVVYLDTAKLTSLSRAATRATHRQVAATHQQAATATNLSLAALGRLERVAAAECYRVNYLRWQVDRAAYGSWRRDVQSARFLARVRPRQGAVVALSHTFRFAARSASFLPLTDCARAESAPELYRPSSAVPFNRVPRARLLDVLRHPPPLPVIPPK